MVRTAAQTSAIFSDDTFRFFRDLSRNNRKSWMDANRERYRSSIVEPFRCLFVRLLPDILKFGDDFEVNGKTGSNFSRINRDIRFAKDKTPYRSQMYLKFPHSKGGGELYVGCSADAVTLGFRIYGESRKGPLAERARPRAIEHSAWLGRNARRLAPRFESYWYSTESSEWTKHVGWPLPPDDWKKLRGWIVRRKLKPTTALRASFTQEISRVFREVNPLLRFTSSPAWEP